MHICTHILVLCTLHYVCEDLHRHKALPSPPPTHTHTEWESSGHCSICSSTLGTVGWSNQQEQSCHFPFHTGQYTTASANHPPIVQQGKARSWQGTWCRSAVLGWAPQCGGTLVERWNLYWNHCAEKRQWMIVARWTASVLVYTCFHMRSRQCRAALKSC